MPYNVTRYGLISALKPSLHPQVKPVLLRDVLRMKRNRGDADAEQFKQIACYQFACRLNETIGGAAWAMRQWIGRADKLGWGDRKVATHSAFLADLDAVLAGDLTGWDISVEAA
jgi:hypothetical protein